MATSTLPASYANVDDVLTAHPMINSVTPIASSHIVYAIGRTQAHMDGILARLYSLPFTAPIPYLTTMAVEGACWFLFGRQFTQFKKNKSEWVQERKDSYREMLDDLIQGRAELVGTDGAVISRSDDVDAWSSTEGYLPTFFEGHETQSEIDQDKIDDALIDREP